MSGRGIEYSVTETGVAWLRLNRPETLNAFTSEMADEILPRLCRAATDDPAVRVVVLTGTGRGFCSGADVGSRFGELSDDSTRLQRPLGYFVNAVWEIPKPVIAAVNGIAAGGGFSLAAAADLRVVAEDAAFVPVFNRRGLMPDGGLSYTLPRLIGRPAATRILLTGQRVEAPQALRLGLADELVAAADLVTATTALADSLAAGPPIALSFTKRALRREVTDFAGQLEFESWGQRVCLATQDFAEGVSAFRERRDPTFRGR